MNLQCRTKKIFALVTRSHISAMPNDTLLRTRRRETQGGKVAKFWVERELLFVATDRISAFDVIMPNSIPQGDTFFDCISGLQTQSFQPNHLVSSTEIHCRPT